MATQPPIIPSISNVNIDLTLPRRFKKGKNPHRALYGLPSLGNHLSLPQLPVPPTAGGWGYKIPDDQWDCLGNDEYSNCLVCAIYHAIMEWTAGTGNPLTVTKDMAVKLYLSWTGGQDTGLDYASSLLHWQNEGVPCLDSRGNTALHKILGFAGLDISSMDHLNAATYLFQGSLLGIQCPSNCADNVTNWLFDPSAVGDGGHAILRNRYGRAGGHIVSWGYCIPHQAQMLATSLDEGYVVVSEEQLNLQGKSPVGFDKDGFLAALAAYKAS